MHRLCLVTFDLLPYFGEHALDIQKRNLKVLWGGAYILSYIRVSYIVSKYPNYLQINVYFRVYCFKHVLVQEKKCWLVPKNAQQYFCYKSSFEIWPSSSKLQETTLIQM